MPAFQSRKISFCIVSSSCLTQFSEEALDYYIRSSFCLSYPRGGIPWWQVEAIRPRNAAFCELADHFMPALTINAQADRVWTMSTRYAATAWRHDQQ